MARVTQWEQVFGADGQRSRGLWKRGNTYYVQCKTKDPQTGLIGQDRHPLFGARTEPQARKLADAVKIKAASGEIYRKQGFPPLADYIPHYLANCHKADHTRDNERGYLKMWLAYFGNIRLSQITAVSILAYRTKALTEEGVTGRTAERTEGRTRMPEWVQPNCPETCRRPPHGGYTTRHESLVRRTE